MPKDVRDTNIKVKYILDDPYCYSKAYFKNSPNMKKGARQDGAKYV